MGKRVNYAARATIIPDSFLKPDEVGVPRVFANILTLQDKVTEYNIDYFRKMITDTDKVKYVIKRVGGRKKIIPVVKETIAEELETGDKIERILQDGDIVLFNRYPSLHRMSIMSHKVKVVEGNALRMHPVSANPYNADHDGDEMQIHVPQKEEGKAEAIELMSVEKNIVSPRHGGIIVGPIEDIVSSSFILTMPTTKVYREDALNYFRIAEVEKIPKPDLPNNMYSGRLVFSSLLPNDMNLRYTPALAKNIPDELLKDDEGTPTSRTVLIENGILKNYIQDRLNARLMNMKSTGNGRRESFRHMPMPRMTNTFMVNGRYSQEEMIKSVDKGIFAVSFGGGQVDITSGKFVFNCTEAYQIENGKITFPVKGATLIGNGPDILTKVSMVGNDMKLDPGIGTCGKNGQTVPVGVGQPSMLIDQIIVGGTKL